MENLGVVSKFAYSMFQTLLADTVIYNFMNTYPKDQWSTVIRCLSLHTIHSVLAKHHTPPSVDRLLSLCTSPYDSHSPYLMREKLSDLRNKVTAIDKQLAEMLGVPLASEMAQASVVEEQVTPQFNSVCRSIRGSHSVTSNRGKQTMKHSVLVPKCKELHEVSGENPYEYEVTRRMQKESAEERQCKSEDCSKGCDAKAQTEAKKKQPKYIQKRVERENKGPNELVGKYGGSSKKQQYINKTNNDTEKYLMGREESFEGHTEPSKDQHKQGSIESEVAREIHKKFLNTEVLRSRESNFFSFGRSFERRTADSDKDTRLRNANVENKYMF
eukprot:TRINITY_DN2294_c0_g1_i4.p1 TRINITY_DN2294_c0_g1~~TRINITY_DN2294_c0_g1_i4.p1  ORF type:complete len:329 (-),score=90.28 TRINITY_DN2294_c0_g1_i4:57-1043(-)